MLEKRLIVYEEEEEEDDDKKTGAVSAERQREKPSRLKMPTRRKVSYHLMRSGLPLTLSLARDAWYS